MSAMSVKNLGTSTKELSLDGARVYHLPNWSKLSHPQRLGVIRQIAKRRGRDPRIAKLVVSILKQRGVQPRDYDNQAAAILAWVQDPKNIYYVNEPGERLQDPIVTLKVGHADCDDMVLLICALFESINLPWRLVLSGRSADGQKARHVEGEHIPSNVDWSHIYCMVGTPPFKPNRWWFCETTIQGVPLGWDVVSGDSSYLPEMHRGGGPSRVMEAPRAPSWFRPVPMPAEANRRSPAYQEALGDLGQPGALGPAIGSAIAGEMEDQKSTINWKNMCIAIATGLTVSVGTQLAMDWIRGRELFEGGGLKKVFGW